MLQGPRPSPGGGYQAAGQAGAAGQHGALTCSTRKQPALCGLSQADRRLLLGVDISGLIRFEQGEAQFAKEVHLLRRLQHPRILQLLGYCVEQEHRALVFPLMKGGSLRRALDTGRSTAFTDGPACSQRLALTWAARLHIAAQVAEGLVYLHKVTKLNVRLLLQFAPTPVRLTGWQTLSRLPSH